MYDNTLLSKVVNLINDEPAAELRKRFVDRGDALNNALDRYFAALAGARKKLSSMFSAEENALMLDACCSTCFNQVMGVRFFPDGIEDAIKFEYLDAKWGVDGAELVKKLQGLDFIDRAALVDAIERWWNTDLDEEPPKFGELLA